MELPQPRPLGKKSTHDFLSLYTHSSGSSSPTPSSSHGNYLKTHDFLQPLERVGKKRQKEAPTASTSSSVEHILPGGIGTYTIRHVSNLNQRALKAEQNCIVDLPSTAHKSKANSSIAGGAFTLWEESELTIAETQVIREPNLGLRPRERALLQQQPHTSPLPPLVDGSINSRSRSRSSFAKSQRLMEEVELEMMKSGNKEKEDEDEDYNNDFLLVSKNTHNQNERANTPRSKHSATEQRRRSKINDRFQILRDLIPQNDQKRDKASFLLEVINYIKFLQEKVHRYETSDQGWNQELMKLTPWRNSHAPDDSMIDPSRAVNSCPGLALMFAGKSDDKHITATPTMLLNPGNTDDPEGGTSSGNKAMEHHPSLEKKAVSVPISLQSNTFSSFGRNGGLAEPPQRLISDANECRTTNGTLNEQEKLTIEGGTISIAGIYSQGLLNNLTQALHSSGVDLSQASISVHVDLGKRATDRLTTLAAGAKDHEDPTSNAAMMHPKVESSGEDYYQTRKRLRTTN